MNRWEFRRVAVAICDQLGRLDQDRRREAERKIGRLMEEAAATVYAASLTESGTYDTGDAKEESARGAEVSPSLYVVL